VRVIDWLAERKAAAALVIAWMHLSLSVTGGVRHWCLGAEAVGLLLC
jgi:hypothetical protein